MRLAAGQLAPDFSVTDIHGRSVQLRDLRGKKVLLAFLRNTACPFCNLRVHELNRHYPALQANGLEIVVFFESTAETIRRSTFLKEQMLTIVADPPKEVYRSYGVEASLWKMTLTHLSGQARQELKEAKALGFEPTLEKGTTASLIPAEFLVDELGAISQAYYGDRMNDHIPVPVIEQFLKVNA